MSLEISAAPAKHSLIHLYAPLRPIKRGRAKHRRKEPPVIPVLVDDPMAIGEDPFLRAPPKGAQTVSDRGELVVPHKKPVEVYTTNNVIARMWMRGQIDKAMFSAARVYEQTYTAAMALKVKTVDPCAPVVSGGSSAADVIDGVLDATNHLERLEKGLRKRYGDEAVALVREVLGDGLTFEKAARRRGDGDRQRAVEWWGTMMRRCLQELAEASGNAVRGAYKNIQRQEERAEAKRKQIEHDDREKKSRGKRRQQR
jgi:hypothetical protein